MQNCPTIKTCDNRLGYLHFYQSGGYIYVSVLKGNLGYFMLLQVFRGVFFCRLSEYQHCGDT